MNLDRGRTPTLLPHRRPRSPAVGRAAHAGRRSVRGPSPRALALLALGTAMRGQVLAMLLPLLAVLVAAFWWVLDSSEAALEKQRLRNTADAAVLAAAVWQAKVQNFDAYTNRAIVANEAFIAQSVSLRGWSAYMDSLLPRASLITAPLPYLGPVMTALQRLWDTMDKALQPSLLAAEGATSALNHDLAAAQRLMHMSVPIAVTEIIRSVVAANDPRYEITAGGDLLLANIAVEWSQFASFYGGSFRWRQQDVVQRSMDGFSHERNWSRGLPVMRLYKRGGTNLINFETWRALDTLAIHTPRYVFFGRMRESVPVAWSSVDNGERTFLRGVHGGAYSTNPRTARLADRDLRHGVGYLGLPSLWDLSAAQRASFKLPVIAVRIALADDRRRGAARFLQFDAITDFTGRDQALGTTEASSKMFAEAAATTSFSRPVARADGANELPSLFNPYWRPRLTQLPLEQRAVLAAVDQTPVWLTSLPR